MKSALITGASRGIGHGIALDLARQGYGLTISARSLDDLERVSEELRTVGAPTVVPYAVDLADRDGLPGLVEAHRAEFTTMDAQILSGGVGTGGQFEKLPLKRVDKTLAVNLTSTIALLQASLPMLRSAAASSGRGARVILLASIAGVFAAPGLAVYGASKAAVIALARSLNAEESPNGVMISAVAPAYVDTDMAAWTADVIPPATMITVDDVVAVARMLLSLGPQTSIPEIVMSRSAGSIYSA